MTQHGTVIREAAGGDRPPAHAIILADLPAVDAGVRGFVPAQGHGSVARHCGRRRRFRRLYRNEEAQRVPAVAFRRRKTGGILAGPSRHRLGHRPGVPHLPLGNGRRAAPLARCIIHGQPGRRRRVQFVGKRSAADGGPRGQRLRADGFVYRVLLVVDRGGAIETGRIRGRALRLARRLALALVIVGRVHRPHPENVGRAVGQARHRVAGGVRLARRAAEDVGPGDVGPVDGGAAVHTLLVLVLRDGAAAVVARNPGQRHLAVAGRGGQTGRRARRHRLHIPADGHRHGRVNGRP